MIKFYFLTKIFVWPHWLVTLAVLSVIVGIYGEIPYIYAFVSMLLEKFLRGKKK